MEEVESCCACAYVLSAAVVALVTVFYYYLTWNFGFLEKQGVKGEKPVPFYGTISVPGRNQPIGHETDMMLFKKYGKLYGAYEGRNPKLVIMDPELIRLVMVKDFNSFNFRTHMEFSSADRLRDKNILNMRGDEWKAVRSIMTPSFTSGKLKQMLSLIEDAAKEMVQNIGRLDSKPTNVKNVFGAFSMDVIAACAFGTKISTATGDNDFAKHANDIFARDLPWQMGVAMIFPKLLKWLPPTLPPNASKFFADTVKDVIRRREAEHDDRKDFLHLMTEAQRESKETANKPGGYVLTNDVLVAQSVLFIFAGHETTAITLTFTAFELALNPDVQERLYNEITDGLTESKGVLDYETIKRMKYLNMVVHEALRKNPPVSRVERTCTTEEYNIGGIRLKEGMKIHIPVHAIHHCEEFYPNPAIFDPERFNDENHAKRNPFTFLPFGSGPRNCIGMRFALLEAKIGLIHLLKNYRVETCMDTEKPLIFYTVPFLRPKSVTLKFVKRTA